MKIPIRRGPWSVLGASSSVATSQILPTIEHLASGANGKPKVTTVQQRGRYREVVSTGSLPTGGTLALSHSATPASDRGLWQVELHAHLFPRSAIFEGPFTVGLTVSGLALRSPTNTTTARNGVDGGTSLDCSTGGQLGGGVVIASAALTPIIVPEGEWPELTLTTTAWRLN